MIDDYGNIYEGTFLANGKANGFCIGYSGKYNEIEMGWYVDDRLYGNWMKLNAADMSIICSGWYDDNICLSPMKPYHRSFQYFQIEDIILDPHLKV